MLDPIFRHRARWSASRIAPWLSAQEHVLDVGAGDCYLDAELRRVVQCKTTQVDVSNTNRTSLPLDIYDGRKLPYPADSFDTCLLLFVLHHADDPAALLQDVKRVCRKRIIAFEDANLSWWDRCLFRLSHRVYRAVLGLSYPRCEWPPARWSALARHMGLVEVWSGVIGRQFGHLSPRHVMYVWESPLQ